MQEVASAPAEIPKEKEEVPQEEAPVNMTKAAGHSISYKVKPGDTLWSIARQFPGVSADNIQAWNKVDGVIKPGEILKIYTASIRDYSPENYPSSL
jgi:membrane-bound lytic murein transglycosylase D